MNLVILRGNLCQDPEVKAIGSGNTVANLRIATNERRKDKDGNWTDHSEYHTVTAWGRTAENAGKYLTKGRAVLVEGRLQTRKWTDKDGKDRYSTEVVAREIEFLGGKDDGGQRGGGGNRPQGQSQQRSTGRQDQGPPPGDDDIPF